MLLAGVLEASGAAAGFVGGKLLCQQVMFKRCHQRCK